MYPTNPYPVMALVDSPNILQIDEPLGILIEISDGEQRDLIKFNNISSMYISFYFLAQLDISKYSPKIKNARH